MSDICLEKVTDTLYKTIFPGGVGTQFYAKSKNDFIHIGKVPTQGEINDAAKHNEFPPVMIETGYPLRMAY